MDHSQSDLELKDAEVDACHIGVITEPECLGPCEPGTSVTLEGIVWNETENGKTCCSVSVFSVIGVNGIVYDFFY